MYEHAVVGIFESPDENRPFDYSRPFGSGFLFCPEPNSIFVVTNKHVIANNMQDKQTLRSNITIHFHLEGSTFPVQLNPSAVRWHPNNDNTGDVAAFQLFALGVNATCFDRRFLIGDDESFGDENRVVLCQRTPRILSPGKFGLNLAVCTPSSLTHPFTSTNEMLYLSSIASVPGASGSPVILSTVRTVNHCRSGNCYKSLDGLTQRLVGIFRGGDEMINVRNLQTQLHRGHVVPAVQLRALFPPSESSPPQVPPVQVQKDL
jgi:hypothetical protein